MLQTLLILIFIRPFISSISFPCANFIYSAILLFFLSIWISYKKISIRSLSVIKYPLALFCLAIIISLTFSQDKIASFKELYKYITGIFLFIIAVSLANENKLRVIRTIVFGGFIISLLAIYQYFFGFQHIVEYLKTNIPSSPFALEYIQRKRAFIPFVTPTALAGYLAMIIPLTLIYKDRMIFIIPLSIALLLTKSLGALLSLFLGIIIYLYLSNKFNRKKILFLLAVGTIIGLVFILRLLYQKQHTQPIFSAHMRLSYWKDCIDIIKAFPLTGVGLGNFNLAQSRYAHNSYLQIWAEMGVFGIIFLILFVETIFRVSLQNRELNTYKKETNCLFVASLIFLISNLTDFSFFLPEVSIIWYIILGLTYSFSIKHFIS